MKIGKAKFDAGIRVSEPKYNPVNPELVAKKGVIILKGENYELPDRYNFKNKNAIFEEVKKEVKHASE